MPIAPEHAFARRQAPTARTPDRGTIPPVRGSYNSEFNLSEKGGRGYRWPNTKPNRPAGGAAVGPVPGVAGCAPGQAGALTTLGPRRGPDHHHPPPGPCEESSGISRARCLIDAALASPLRGDGTLPAKLDRVLRAALGKADGLLARADGSSGGKQAELLRKARQRLGATPASSIEETLPAR